MTIKISPDRLTHLLISSVVVAGLVSMPLAVLPPPVEASTPGYNGKIAFVSTRDGNDEIYAMDADGSNQTRLTNNVAIDKDPSWSPDGSKIAFLSSRDGNSEIYVMGADGSNLTRLTVNSTTDIQPSWSPDGTKITFTSNQDGNNEIYLMNADGTNRTRITTNAANDSIPSWFSASSKLLFTSTRTGHTEIYTMNDDGSNAIQITNHTYSSSSPKMSPDETKIVYTDGGISGNNEIYQINLDGSAPLRLTNNADNESFPYYSPDGTKIVYTRLSGMVNYIYVMNADGSEQIPLTTAMADGRAVQWQPILNQAPVTASDTLTTGFNTANFSDVLTNDSDEAALDAANLTISAHPSHGAASIENGKVNYTPNQGFVGSDQLTYQICDSFMLDQKCATGVLGITVTSGPAPATPTIFKIGSVTTNGTAKVYYTGHRPTFAGASEAGSSIRVEINSDPIILITTADNSGTWSVTPDQDIPNGEHTVTITATKGGSTSTPLSFVLGINVDLADTGMPLWPISVVGILSVVVTQFVLKRRIAA